jgi:tripartite ATP-independent transporter DctM subunit
VGDWLWILLLVLGGLLGLLATGLPVAFSFLVVNLVGAFILWGGFSGLGQLVDTIYSSVTMFALLPVPLFVFLGEILFHSGLAFKAIDIVDTWLGRVPGRLCLVTLGSGTMFSCLSGSSMGTTAMLGSIMIPEMKKRGYSPIMSIGSCMSGGLAMIIPPSALAVILASIARVSVGKVLLGGFLPGFLLALMYTIYIVGRCYFNPRLAPSYQPSRIPMRQKLAVSFKYLFPLSGIVFVVVGLIFLGISTPTEAAAMGALAAVLLAAAYGRLNFEVIRKSVEGTVKISVMMFTILTGSLAFSQIMAYTGATSGLVEWVSTLPLPPIVLIIAMQLVILILGTFMEAISIMMITLPVFMPLVKALHVNEVWFVIMMLINLEVAMKTPPFGFLLFVMRGVAPPEVTMGDIFKATIPFVLIDMLAIALILLFPSIVLLLPEHIMR